jgi:HK97 gp10 family phage protein
MELTLTGSKAVYANLDNFTVVLRDKLLKRAMGRVTRPIEQAAKAACPVDLGTLRDSISTKTTSKKGKGTNLHAIIGPKRRVRVPIGIVRRGPNKGKIKMAIPTRYAHLVEFGHTIVRNGSIIGHAAPIPFMRKAWDTAGGEIALNLFETELEAAIASEVIKVAIASTSP